MEMQCSVVEAIRTFRRDEPKPVRGFDDRRGEKKYTACQETMVRQAMAKLMQEAEQRPNQMQAFVLAGLEVLRSDDVVLIEKDGCHRDGMSGLPCASCTPSTQRH